MPTPLQKALQDAGIPVPDGVTEYGSDAHVNDNVDPVEQQEQAGQSPVTAATAPPANPVLAQSAPSLAADLGKSSADRLSTLEAKKAQLEAPPSTKQRIFQSLAAALPTVAGAVVGGRFGAAGAAQGTATAVEEALQRSLAQDQLLNQQIEAERGRQEHASDLAAQLEQQRLKTAEQLAATKMIVGGRENVAGQNNTTKTTIAGQNNATKTTIADTTAATRQKLADEARDAQMQRAGFTKDDSGNYVATPEKQAKDKAEADYKQALTDHAAAQAELERARNDPNSPAYKQAQARLTSTAQRLALSQQQFEMRAFGTNNGQALPGAMLTPEGSPVGTAFQGNVRPTGQERNKGDMATSAHEQIQTIKDIVAKRADIFGPVAGRKTDFNVWLGSQDPDAQRFIAARTIAGDHLAGTFGGRSEAALQALDNAIGQFKTNPQAVQAGLDQIDKANNVFMQKGKVNTAPGPKAKLSSELKTLDETRARQYLQKANGDKTKARALAKADGYVF